MKPRYIDANKLNKKKKYSFQTQGGCFPKSEWFIKADDFFAAPTEDVVKVVRCKDCEYGEADYGWDGKIITPFQYHCEYEDTWNRTDHYCGYGKRKEGSNNG